MTLQASNTFQSMLTLTDQLQYFSGLTEWFKSILFWSVLKERTGMRGKKLIMHPRRDVLLYIPVVLHFFQIPISVHHSGCHNCRTAIFALYHSPVVTGQSCCSKWTRDFSRNSHNVGILLATNCIIFWFSSCSRA